MDDNAGFDYGGVRRAYDIVAEDYARFFPDTRPEADLDLAMIDAFIAAVGTGARVLDAGCGAGRMSRYLADRGIGVEGLDLSPAMIEMARQDHPDLTFSVGSISDLPFEDAIFDAVVLWYSTIHTPPPGQPRLFGEVARVLEPRGWVIVGFQTGEGVQDVAPAYRRHGHEVELVRYRFRPDEVSGWLGAAGLEETCRLVRQAQGSERDGQAVLIAQTR